MKPLCLALCVALAATGARASDPVYEAQDKPPDVYGPLVWRAGGVDTHGIWARDEAIQRLQLKIDYLTDKAAKECTTETQAANKAWVGSQSSLWVVAGAALLVGIAGGVYAAKKL